MAEETKKTTAKAAPKKAAAPKAEAKKAEKKFVSPEPTNRLAKKYRSEVVPELVKEFGYSTIMMAPRLEKIVINMGVGDATSNSKALDDAVNDLTILSGQKPVITKAKKSIASFKLREGQAIGCKVTLRGERRFESSTNSSQSPSPASVTSAASPATPSTAMATTPWASRNN